MCIRWNKHTNAWRTGFLVESESLREAGHHVLKGTVPDWETTVEEGKKSRVGIENASCEQWKNDR